MIKKRVIGLYTIFGRSIKREVVYGIQKKSATLGKIKPEVMGFKSRSV